MAQFEAQWPLQVGDADGNRFTANLDASLINTLIPCFVNCLERFDLDGNGFVNNLDVSVLNTVVPSFRIPKPAGH